MGEHPTLSAAQLQRSVRIQGAHGRFAQAWARLRAGLPLKIAVLGASVAMEGGCQREHQQHVRCSDYDGATRMARRAYRRPREDAPGRGFALRALDLLNATAPHRAHRIYNAAADGWTTDAQEGCILSAVPVDADLVIMDPASVYEIDGGKGMSRLQLEATERVVRRLLRFPRAPAFMLLLVSPWCRKVTRMDTHRTRADIEHWLTEFPNWEAPFESICRTYQVPCVSYRAAVSNELLADRPGFRLEDVAADCSHPADSRFGAQYLGDVLVSYLNASLRRVADAVVLPPETTKLPKPVIGRNSAAFDRAITRCYQTPYRPDRQVVGNVSVRCARRKRSLLRRLRTPSPPIGIRSTRAALRSYQANWRGFQRLWRRLSTVAKSAVSHACYTQEALPDGAAAQRRRARTPRAQERCCEHAALVFVRAARPDRGARRLDHLHRAAQVRACAQRVAATQISQMRRASAASRAWRASSAWRGLGCVRSALLNAPYGAGQPFSPRCALASSPPTRACLSGREHWQYCSRSLALASVRKPGLVAFVPGATLAVEIDTTIPSTHGRALVTLSHLVSYEGMGRARISCVSGCECAPHVVDSLVRNGSNVSIAVVHRFRVSPSPACLLHITNLGDHSGEIAKWKLLSLSVVCGPG